jgi:hypothetical protein
MSKQEHVCLFDRREVILRSRDLSDISYRAYAMYEAIIARAKDMADGEEPIAPGHFQRLRILIDEAKNAIWRVHSNAESVHGLASRPVRRPKRTAANKVARRSRKAVSK